MTSDFCRETVAHLSNAQILSSETLAPQNVASGSVVGVNRTSSAAMELGRRLLVAARAGDTNTVLDLMGKGAPFTADWLGTSPLHLAAVNAHAETCAVLLRSGVSRDLRTKVDRTPLHLAAYAGHAHIAKLLLEHDAQVDCRDMLRMTPLHWAVERGHPAVVAVLLRHGADPAAISKFHKTPHSLAVERQNHEILKLIEDAIKDREAALSVDALVNEHMTESLAIDQNIQNFDRIVHKIKETKPSSKPKEEPRADSKTTQNECSDSKEVTAAQILRKHGITLLPTDDGSTVLNAIQSGRTVVLSDAGKLMLKESESDITSKKTVNVPSSQKGVVLTATPVKTPPKPGVKIFTLNNKFIALPKENNKLPIKKIINPQLKQVKIVQLSPDTKVITTNKTTIPMKAKTKVVRPVVSLASNRLNTSHAPAVKIIMNKSNFNKLLANTETTMVEDIDTEVNQNLAPATTETKTLEEDVDDILTVREDVLLRCSAKYLRTHALAARRALAALRAQLDHYKARLSQYEQTE